VIGESDEVVRRKAAAAVNAGSSPNASRSPHGKSTSSTPKAASTMR